jgi:hypothetical protein
MKVVLIISRTCMVSFRVRIRYWLRGNVIPLVAGAVVGRAATAVRAPRRLVPAVSGRFSTNTGHSGRGGLQVTATSHQRSK